MTENNHFTNEVHEYVINGATYIVGSACASTDEPKTLKDRLKSILLSDFTHLDISENDDTIIDEMCSTVGKEEHFAVEKESA